MEDWQQRVVDEKAELDGRLKRLTDFFTTSRFSGLNGAEKDRMQRQASYMQAYSTILGERIAAFDEQTVRVSET